MESLLTENSSILISPFVVFSVQMIDGGPALAYGVSSNSVLLALGVPPKLASASTHAAEVVTTAISGFPHFRVGNVDKQLVFRLILPGMVGGATGAYLLTHVDGDTIKPYIAIYLLIMGLVILARAFVKIVDSELKKGLIPPSGNCWRMPRRHRRRWMGPRCHHNPRRHRQKAPICHWLGEPQ
jgi:uncharacterized membrane protein YfcA